MITQDLPAGAYRLRLVTTSNMVTKNSKHFIKLEWCVTDGPYTGSPVWSTLAYDGVPEDRYRATLVALHTDLTTLLRHPVRHFGREVLANVSRRNWHGRVFPEVRAIYATHDVHKLNEEQYEAQDQGPQDG